MKTETLKIIDALLKELDGTFPHLRFNSDIGYGDINAIHYIDVIHNDKLVWVLQVFDIEGKITYGVSIIDDDTGMDYHADLTCGHAPTFIKYLKMLLPPKKE